MKQITLIIALFFVVFTTYAQKKIDKDPNWKVGEIKTFRENQIKRIEGENNGKSVTNITYQTLKQLIDNVNSGKLRGDAKKKQLKNFKDYAPGGMVIFYVNRATAAAANLKNFTLIVKDKTGKEIYKRTYKDKAAKTNSKDGGYYISTNLQVKYKVEKPFIIELNDGKTLYKFEVLE